MRIVFIGCVEFSANLLRCLLEKASAGRAFEVVGVVTRHASRVNSDFHDLSGIARSASVEVFLAEGNDQSAMAEWISSLNPDLIYCFGWSYLLRHEILQIPKRGVVGYHPAALPQNRGRHPIIWALALGLTATASTFFLMDQGADSGDILSQRAVSIADEDDATTLYSKLLSAAKEQMIEFSLALAGGTEIITPQDHTQANYWRKRGKSDGQIDWRMSARGVRNLIRALAVPYPGAHCVVNAREIKIWRGEIVAGVPENLESGKILSRDGDMFVVKCGVDAIKITKHEFETIPQVGEYL